MAAFHSHAFSKNAEKSVALRSGSRVRVRLTKGSTACLCFCPQEGIGFMGLMPNGAGGSVAGGRGKEVRLAVVHW